MMILYIILFLGFLLGVLTTIVCGVLPIMKHSRACLKLLSEQNTEWGKTIGLCDELLAALKQKENEGQLPTIERD